jgi:hypothetical protein
MKRFNFRILAYPLAVLLTGIIFGCFRSSTMLVKIGMYLLNIRK